ncbi:hypothetical protein GCM10010873_05290 [Cypionkella aquatica]|uniref:Uncharacterized protein n=1 Tax=Cypionkella aquatica TaxID=1756042 RepID=A0AA37U3Z1_9RHOB|nr:hypothetical protein GCM10010873_05290 [Cypionkella aquatica]
MAKYCPRILQSLVYNALYRRLGDSYALNPNDFLNKSVLVIGPAASAHLDLQALDVAGFDIIVKMNNAIHTEINGQVSNPLRCDVLFHSFRGATKPVTAEDLRVAGVKTIVHRTLKRRAFLATLQLEEKFRSVAQMRIVPVHKYVTVSKQLAGHAASTGMICAEFFLHAPVSRLALVGFTFFSTRYVNGYDDTIVSDEIALARIETIDYHSPVHEARLMYELIAKAQLAGKNIYISETMQQAMDFMRLRDPNKPAKDKDI